MAENSVDRTSSTAVEAWEEYLAMVSPEHSGTVRAHYEIGIL